MKIDDILNPLPDTRLRPRVSNAVYDDELYANEEDVSEDPPAAPLSGKKAVSKEAKDGARFEEGSPVGEVSFPPFEIVSEENRTKMAPFRIFPRENIASYPRHIPYTSSKKSFQLETGRDAFEVFQYTFKYRDNSKEWVVMWDYNIGLVRITPFFKCLGYSKIIPAKAIAMTPGLKEICYSITGGSIAAQGYWLPFDAARALAAKFCEDIRYALIPVFGEDFATMCETSIDVTDTDFTIDQEIVEHCKAEVLTWTEACEDLSTDQGDLNESLSGQKHHKSGNVLVSRDDKAIIGSNSMGEEIPDMLSVPRHVIRLRYSSTANRTPASENLRWNADLSGSVLPSGGPGSLIVECSDSGSEGYDKTPGDTNNDEDTAELRQRKAHYSPEEIEAAWALVHLSRS